MDDMKDKVKGFMKKVSFASSSGKFKGQGRVLGSSSAGVPTNSVPTDRLQALSLNKNQSPSTRSNPKPTNSDQSTDKQKSETRIDKDGNTKSRDGFDPFDSLITTGKRNPNGYSLNVLECPVCGGGFGSQEEVSSHVDSCLNNAEGNDAVGVNEGENFENGEMERKSDLEAFVGAYISGKPSTGSKEVVLKLLNNVVREPENVKFRKIRLGNPKIKEAVGDVPGGVELLECVGFELREEGGEIWAVMDIPSKDQLLLVKNAISLLDLQEAEALPSSTPVKTDEITEPKKVDRQIRVFFSVSESLASKIELPDSFYNLSREELKREADMRKKKIEESQLLIPRSYKEKLANATKKRYDRTIIRIQFPDGVVLQAVFSSLESTTALYEFVGSALKESSLEFELLHPVLVKRRVIPHFPAPGKRAITLEEEDLVPAALVKFRPIETDSVVFTGLRNELLEISEPLIVGSAVTS